MRATNLSASGRVRVRGTMLQARSGYLRIAVKIGGVAPTSPHCPRVWRGSVGNTTGGCFLSGVWLSVRTQRVGERHSFVASVAECHVPTLSCSRNPSDQRRRSVAESGMHCPFLEAGRRPAARRAAPRQRTRDVMAGRAAGARAVAGVRRKSRNGLPGYRRGFLLV